MTGSNSNVAQLYIILDTLRLQPFTKLTPSYNTAAMSNRELSISARWQPEWTDSVLLISSVIQDAVQKIAALKQRKAMLHGVD